MRKSNDLLGLAGDKHSKGFDFMDLEDQAKSPSKPTPHISSNELLFPPYISGNQVRMSLIILAQNLMFVAPNAHDLKSSCYYTFLVDCQPLLWMQIAPVSAHHC